MNVWAFISLFIGLFHLSLGVYVLYKNHKRPINVTFALMAFSLAIWCISEFGHRIADRLEIAYIWVNVGGFGWCLMASFCTHFILVFSRQEKILKSKLTYIALYLPSIIILYFFLTTDLIYKHEPIKRFYGYTYLPGDFVWVFTLSYMLLYFFVIYLIVRVMRGGNALEKRQAKPMFLGSTIFLALTTLTNIVYPTTQESVPELGTAFSVIWGISVFYAVLKHRLFDVEPSIEEPGITPKQYYLEKGHVYLIREEYPDKGYQIFYDQITHGSFGLCITKLEPEKVRERYKLAKTPIIWLTFNSVESAILPRDIDGLTSIVSDFVRKTEGSLFFFDCFGQIKLVNGFVKSISMLKDFKKLCNENNSIMLISIFPKMFDEQQLAVIEGELEKVGV